MACLRLPNGRITTDADEMRKNAVHFYTALYRAEDCDQECAADLSHELIQLGPSEQAALDSSCELTAAVGQLASGRARGIDGLPAHFYKCFWRYFRTDVLDVLSEFFRRGSLPASCRRAALTILPKKGDLALLKNWHPVALLCTDYKLLSKVLANRLKEYLDILVHRDQSYCVPDRSIMDNLFLV